MLILEEHMEIAERAAKASVCLRRKYGAAISNGAKVVAVANNYRVGRCCNGNLCLRDRLSVSHGTRIEAGAELHAEAVVLLHWHFEQGPRDPMSHFYLAGYDRNGELLKGLSVRPCYYCAMMIAYSGFRNIITRREDNSLQAIPIWEIIEEYEQVYAEPVYPV